MENAPGESVTVQFSVSTAIGSCAAASTEGENAVQLQQEGDEQEFEMLATDEEVMQLAAEEYPETAFPCWPQMKR